MAIALLAGDVPRNSIKARLRQPAIVGVLIWAALGLVVTRHRESLAPETYPAGTVKGNVITMISGAVIWLLIAFWLHELLIGVRPLP